VFSHTFSYSVFFLLHKFEDLNTNISTLLTRNSIFFAFLTLGLPPQFYLMTFEPLSLPYPLQSHSSTVVTLSLQTTQEICVLMQGTQLLSVCHLKVHVCRICWGYFWRKLKDRRFDNAHISRSVLPFVVGTSDRTTNVRYSV